MAQRRRWFYVADSASKLTNCISPGPEAGLPLGQNSSFLAAVTKAKVAPSSVWGLDAGDRSLSPRDGKLVVGGYDTARIAANLTTFPLGNWTKQRPCPLQVAVTDIEYLSPNRKASLLPYDNNDGVIACIEPFQQRFTLLPTMVQNFAHYTGYDHSYPGLTFPTNMRPNGELYITFDNGYVTTIPNDHLFTPKRGSDESGHYVVTNSSIVETGMVYNADDADADAQIILGGLFLTFNYLVVDYVNNQFQMAPVQRSQATSPNIITVCTPTPTTASPGAQAPAEKKRGPSSAAAIGGATAGAVVGLAAIAGIYFVLLRKRRQPPDPQPIEETCPPTILQPGQFSDAQTPSELALVPHPIQAIACFCLLT